MHAAQPYHFKDHLEGLKIKWKRALGAVYGSGNEGTREAIEWRRYLKENEAVGEQLPRDIKTAKNETDATNIIYSYAKTKFERFLADNRR
jgi:hypothetical protein